MKAATIKELEAVIREQELTIQRESSKRALAVERYRALLRRVRSKRLQLMKGSHGQS